MGFIAKQRTKSRTAPATYPADLPSKWRRYQFDAIVRAAATSAGSETLRSSAFRGSDTLGIGSMLKSGSSTLWVEQAGLDGHWTVTLGLDTTTGPAIDWQIVFEPWLGDEAQSVSITTPNVLMSDGAQVNRDVYTDLRELVVAGLTAGGQPEHAPELAAGEAGLRLAIGPLAQAALTPYEGQFTITTRLDVDGVQDALTYVDTYPHPAKETRGRRWLVDPAGTSWIDLTVREVDGLRALEFDVHLAHDENEVANVVTTQRAKLFVVMLQRVITFDDATCQVAGDARLVGGSA